MTASLGERALLAVEALILPISIANGWQIDAGLNVRVSPVFVDLVDDLYWESLIYTAAEEITGFQGGPVVAVSRRISVAHFVNVDVFTSIDPGREGQQFQRIKGDIRKALSPQVGGLSDATGPIGQIEHLGAAFIAEKLDSGLIGVNTRIKINYIEAWGDPSRAL
jgi:hypothetical protein